jgi:hypothetical protein
VDNRELIDVLTDLEISLVRAFNWSLHDIDETAVESLLPFVGRFGKQKGSPPAAKRTAYADEVDWL